MKYECSWNGFSNHVEGHVRNFCSGSDYYADRISAWKTEIKIHI